ncbi:MAG: flagellar basal body rod protein FlgF [Granulosicoccus sp.]|nr:flagellar basal body rod protein FlgF [Granulosicoccus sp.]
MDKMIYVAMSGAKSAMALQATNNHNLANINTTGFREDLAASVTHNVPDQALQTRAYVDVDTKGVNVSAGQIVNTGRDLDIAIEGDGLIAVMNPDGSEAYTRAGNLRISPTGLLETIDGLPVMGNNGPITISPYESLEIAEDGTISIVPLGDEGGTLAVLDRIKLVNPDTDQLQRNNNGTLGLPPQLVRKTTLVATEEGGVERNVATEYQQPFVGADGTVTVVNGALETSNVNPSHAMITMVELSRIFEMQMKLMKTAEENDAAINRILT